MNLIELRNHYRENLNSFSFKESDYLLKILLKENFNLESTFINLNPGYKLEESQKVALDIYNILGEKISSESLHLSAGNHILIKNFDLNSGHYFVNITNNSGLNICSKKLIVVK